MRYVAGTVTRTSPPTVGPRPRGGHEIHHDATLRAWTVGHDPHELRRAVSRDGAAEVILVGACLPSVEEARCAADAAARGRWHEAGQLPGSYLAIVTDRGTVRVLGDRAGTVQVHWIVTGSAVTWSTSASALAALTGAAPDLVRLLAEVTTWGAEPGADGWFEGIHRVPPGAALTLAPDTPPSIEQPPVPAGRSFAEAADALRHELPLAVGRRALSGRLSSDLSGGVDSSSIACLAAAHTDLTAVTYVDAAMADQDDTRYAAEIAAANPAITRHLVDGRFTGSRHYDQLADLAGVPVTDAPALSVAMLGIMEAQLAPAVAAASTGHLTGWGGDNVLDAFASPADRYRSGARAAGLRDAHRLARDRRAAAHPVLRATAASARGSYPKALARLASAVLTGPAPQGIPDAADVARWCGPLSAARWLTPAGRTAVADLVGGRVRSADPAIGPGALRERLALEATGAEFANFDALTRALFDLPLHAPFLDTRVIDICLAVPAWERHRPGDFKPLARAALTGLVHAPLLARRTKTPFTGIYDGLRVNAPALRALLAGSTLAQAGLIDTSAVLASLDRTIHGSPADLVSLHGLVAAEVWLTNCPSTSTFDGWWEPAPARESAR
ncbi:asparagine synthase-related protein [Kitasatospora kifunensis]|uniref:Asparagine synthase (Glutamine-hydrolyzing) n=1 Tax=Kitasatospora kifunensis TaxID=58351 RepID=A0A7W7RBT4_KITKI|nr:asparagine synthase-related protein [Kitasatospora kifunensis]MBB4929072.1 asparagine synthase (glutamine-hydrolyzing) [Kitasatospora kifunensis]